MLRVGETLLVYNELETPLAIDQIPVEPGVSPARALAEILVDLAAPTPNTVLITGPTGAGKELLAQRLHAHGKRAGPFVAVNCATFSRDLLGSELFGHVRGAFSGAATNRAGLFVAATGGTLFLDEIADFPLEQQPALLRALQEKRVRPVGADREVAVDVRVVAATHRDLDALEREGLFRADLLGRVAGVRIDLPGLADRREEILTLFRSAVGEPAPPCTLAAAEALLLHDWPHNVREIQQAAASVRMFAPAVDAIGPGLLPAAVQRSARQRAAKGVDPEAPLDKSELLRLLEGHGGNVASVARAIGKSRQQVYRLLQMFRVDASAFRGE